MAGFSVSLADFFSFLTGFFEPFLTTFISGFSLAGCLAFLMGFLAGSVLARFSMGFLAMALGVFLEEDFVDAGLDLDMRDFFFCLRGRGVCWVDRRADEGKVPSVVISLGQRYPFRGITMLPICLDKEKIGLGRSYCWGGSLYGEGWRETLLLLVVVVVVRGLVLVLGLELGLGLCVGVGV